MSWKIDFSVFLLVGIVACLCIIHSQRQQLQDVRTQLVFAQGEVQTLQARLNAMEEAANKRQQMQKEIDNAAAQREKLLNMLPDSWNNAVLPAECVRVLQAGPDSKDGAGDATGDTDAGN